MRNLILTLFLLTALGAEAQFSYGFRAGLSYSKLLGDSEISDAGMTLDEYRFASGFHIGLSTNYAITDLFGFRGEIIFTQRGTQYKYDGDSYYILERRTTKERVIPGRRIQDYNISMAAFEIPIVAYYRIGSLEVLGGINTAFLLSSSGGGTIDFEGISPSGKDIDPFSVRLQYNFNKDEAKGSGPLDLLVKVDNQPLYTPSYVGAYYDFEEKNGSKFNTLDVGIVGGLAYYMNQGLYISGRVTYGLLDADDDQYDISLYKLDADNKLIYRTDKNQHLTIQASIGFLF